MEQTTIRDTVDMELERESGELPSLDDDFLYLVTYQTKKVFQWITRWCSRLGSSFSIFLQITQPAHLIAMLAVITLATLLYPNQQRGLPSTLKNLIYLGSFSTCLGTQIWMTFMSGLSLYFSLPRHHFGKVQRVLFPRYFMFNAALNLLTLTMYTDQQHGAVRSEQAWQILTLCISFAINLFVWLYMAPPLLHYMQEKNQIEEAAGIGMEVGDYNLGPLLSCPDYVKVYKAFRSIHMKIAVGNITTLACTTFHLYYISSNITIRH